RLSELAAGELKGADAGGPAVGGGGGVVLVGVPEGAVVGGVDGEVGVVAPAGTHCLDAGAGGQGLLAAGQDARRVTREAAGVADSGEHVGAVGNAVAEGHVPVLVLRDAAHPAVDAVVRGVGALLEQARPG